jgi:hypothetical protein
VQLEPMNGCFRDHQRLVYGLILVMVNWARSLEETGLTNSRERRNPKCQILPAQATPGGHLPATWPQKPRCKVFVNSHRVHT